MKRIKPYPLRIQVPGSSSNLGPGFDLLGLAVPLFLHLEARPAAFSSISRRGELTSLPHPPGQDLILVAAKKLLRKFRLKLPPVELRLDSEIPISRGVGSSGAAVAAGLALANAWLGKPLDTLELIQLGTEIEGHPENVAASFLGGCTASIPITPRTTHHQKVSYHRDLRVVLSWTDKKIQTSQARKVLPARVSFADAVEQPRRLTLLYRALRTLEPDVFREAMVDRLNTPYRGKLIPGFVPISKAAYRSGALGVTVSGSGSAVLAFARKGGRKIQQAMARAAARHRSGARAVLLKPQRKGLSTARLG